MIARLRARRSGKQARRALQVRWHSADRDRDRLLARVDVSPDRRHWSSVYLGPDRHALRVSSAMVPAGRLVFVRVTLEDGFNQTVVVGRAR